MKKLFGEINLTWPKLIVFAIIAGLYTALMAILPTKDTSFGDITVTFEVWILFGILIIMNSKSPKDSALKCFIFFLISQPLVYLVQDILYSSHLFVLYYRNWVGWTLLTIPMGYIGYYIKKDRWYSLVILVPMLIFVALIYYSYFSEVISFFPNHLLTTIFCLLTLLLYPLVLLNSKKLKMIGVTISVLLLLGASGVTLMNGKMSYSTVLMISSVDYDDTYEVYLKDAKYGDVSIKYYEDLDGYMIDANFTKQGSTQLILTAPDGTTTTFDLKISRDSYSISEAN